MTLTTPFGPGLQAAALAFALAACDPRAAVVPAGDPGSPGPYPVGVTTRYLGDIGPYYDIPVEVWYPAAAAGPADAKATYEPLGAKLPADAWRDVPPDPSAPLYLVAFSHGLGGIREQNYTMAERLASFGFVVVSPDHPGTTTADFLEDVGALEEPLAYRPGTVIAAVDLVLGGAIEGLEPRGEGYAMVGHSLGSVTSLAVAGGRIDVALYAAFCESQPNDSACGIIGPLDPASAAIRNVAPPDPRVVTTVLQAATGAFAFDPGSLLAVPRPLVMVGTRDGFYRQGGTRAVWEALQPGAAFVTYPEAGHNAPTDVCSIPIANALAPECGGPEKGFVDPATVRAVAVRHTVAWVGLHLGGQPAFESYLGPGDGFTWETTAGADE